MYPIQMDRREAMAVDDETGQCDTVECEERTVEIWCDHVKFGQLHHRFGHSRRRPNPARKIKRDSTPTRHIHSVPGADSEAGTMLREMTDCATLAATAKRGGNVERTTCIRSFDFPLRPAKTSDKSWSLCSCCHFQKNDLHPMCNQVQIFTSAYPRLILSPDLT